MCTTKYTIERDGLTLHLFGTEVSGPSKCNEVVFTQKLFTKYLIIYLLIYENIWCGVTGSLHMYCGIAIKSFDKIF